MAPDPKQIRNQVTAIARHPRTRKIAIWFVAIVAAVGILLGLVAPPLLRGKIASELSKKLHRDVTIAQIRINPYTMTVAVRGFLMKERQSQTTAISFDEVFVNLDIRSLFRLAPVIQEFRLTKPYVNLVRDTDYKYNFQDLIDEFTAGPSGPTPRFAVNNIEILDGKIDFDDRPEQTKHSISALKIGIPFISSLPSYADIKVKPELSAVINGAPFHLAGDMTAPFGDTLESALRVNINTVEIQKYLEYSPVALNFKVPSGQLGGQITISFKSSKNKPAMLSIRGNLGLKQFEMQQPNGAPLLKLPAFDLVIDDLEVLANKLTVKSVASQGLQLNIVRGRDGSLNFANLVTAPAKSTTTEPKKEATPFIYAIDEIAIDGVTLQFTDEQRQRTYKTRLSNLVLKITALSNQAGKKANVDLTFESDAKEKFSHAGTLQLSPLAVEGKLEIVGLKPAALQPYYQDTVAAELKDGSLDVATQYSIEVKNDQLEIKLAGLNATLRALRLELAGQPEPLLRIASLAIKDANVDVGKKTLTIGALEAKDGSGYLQRAADGTINYAKLTKATTAATTAATPAKKDGNDWSIEAKQIIFDRFKMHYDDRAAATPAEVNLSELSIRGDNFSIAKNRQTRVTLRTRINNKGALRMSGSVMANPVNAKLAIEGEDIDLLPFQPYLENQVNFLLTSGRLGTKGNLIFDTSSSPSKLNYDGSLNVADFATVEKGNAQDLLKWKSLALNPIQFNLAPFQLRIGEITLSDFYSRLILESNGKLNLQNLTAQKDEKKIEKAPADQPAEKPAPTNGSEKAISIGRINLEAGNINFSDFFVKPNYSANLTGVQGSISELKTEAPGDLDIKARLDNAAPVLISGKINPLSKDLFLDIVADAKEIELNPMTPYSAKYVGYGIEKGKLSFNVKYKLENRKLSAENKIILNQLTFGEKIESPDATKLPVLLAVALLKDRNGVIDVDLPISGSLDDPQFSVGGIVWRIIINIITKAVTAPFSLLASAFGSGGSGEELSYIEFDNGRATINQPGQAKIATLAKALNNRPALNLELTGRVDPASDLEGLKRVMLERKVKAQKLKLLVRRGEAQKSLDDVPIESGEYAQYLKAAYGDESFPKPRNIIGLAQDLPVPEMEKLMLQNTKVSDDDLRQVANQRAQVVRDALLATGQVGAERLFIVAGKPLTSDELANIKGKPNRVDFSMK
jgi:uncharacterized protein involved in outer membrane biogenesis